MKIISKRTNIVYDNIVLVKFLDEINEEIVDTEDIDEVNFKNYDFAYSRLCEDCIKAGNFNPKHAGIEVETATCGNINCESNLAVYEVIFEKEEIHNDFKKYNN